MRRPEKPTDPHEAKCLPIGLLPLGGGAIAQIERAGVVVQAAFVGNRRVRKAKPLTAGSAWLNHPAEVPGKIKVHLPMMNVPARVLPPGTEPAIEGRRN